MPDLPFALITPAHFCCNHHPTTVMVEPLRAKAYGSYNSLQEKLETRFLAESTSSGTRKITYKLFKPDFFVISGIENNKVFYEKILYKDDTYKTLLISYPTALKKTYDPITAKIARSFKHSQ
jgi:hypothetical protein